MVDAANADAAVSLKVDEATGADDSSSDDDAADEEDDSVVAVVTGDITMEGADADCSKGVGEAKAAL